MAVSRKVSTCLWFDGDGEEAAKFYTSLIPGSEITGFFRPSDEGPALIVEFSLGQTPYLALNGGPKFRHSEAASIVVGTRAISTGARFPTPITIRSSRWSARNPTSTSLPSSTRTDAGNASCCSRGSLLYAGGSTVSLTAEIVGRSTAVTWCHGVCPSPARTRNSKELVSSSIG